MTTHCCFCGQQCGIQLKVKDEQSRRLRAVGRVPVQPREALSQGRQALHAGRAPRSPADAARARRGRAASSRSTGTTRSTARPREIQRIQAAYGRDAFAVLTGASLTNEKAYLMGKFARVALRTANIDYNGRLCMVSAAAASKKILGIDRSANPWSDIPKAKVDPRRRREHRRVRADHHRLPVAGARERREAHRARSADDADRAHRGPLHPGALRRRHRRLQRHAARDDRARLDRSRLHRRAHDRLGGGRADRRALHAGVRRRRSPACRPR